VEKPGGHINALMSNGGKQIGICRNNKAGTAGSWEIYMFVACTRVHQGSSCETALASIHEEINHAELVHVKFLYPSPASI
jgi:hypothetical protein